MREPSPSVAHVDLAEAVTQGPPPAGNLAVPIFSQGTLVPEMYTPKGHDPQTPHDRDEVYVVARGRGTFFDGVGRRVVSPGTFRFVAAAHMHRFEDFPDDVAVWLFFYGPPGGERGSGSAR
jgi:hypothetical protein